MDSKIVTRHYEHTDIIQKRQLFIVSLQWDVLYIILTFFPCSFKQIISILVDYLDRIY